MSFFNWLGGVFGYHTQYNAASRVKRTLKKWRAFLTGPNSDLPVYDRVTAVARCRDAYRNQPFVKAIVDRRSLNVIGPGLVMNSSIDNDVLELDEQELNEKQSQIERDFNRWANSALECDIEGKKNFFDKQVEVFRAAELAGDVFVVTPYLKRNEFGLKINVVEGDRVCNRNWTVNTKNLVDGVALDNNGMPIAFEVLIDHPFDYDRNQGIVNEWVRVPVFGISTKVKRNLQVMHQDRPNQFRGIPTPLSVLETLKGVDKYAQAELMAAMVNADPALVIESDFPEVAKSLGSTKNSASGGSEEGSSDQEREIEFEAGSIIELFPGEKLKAHHPARPNTQYDPFVLAKLREVGAAMNMPLEILIMHFTSSFSASRAALLEFWKYVECERARFARQFCQPLFELWMDEQVASGRLVAPMYNTPEGRAAWTRCFWIGPARGQIQEMQAISAAEKRIAMGISNRKIEAAKLGHDIDVVLQQLAREESKIKELDLTIVGIQALNQKEPLPKKEENDEDDEND